MLAKYPCPTPAELLMRGRIDLYEAYVVANSPVADFRPTCHSSDGAGDRLDDVYQSPGHQRRITCGLFSVARGTERGRTFVTPDGRAALDVYAGPNDRGETPAQLLRRTVSRSRLTYTRVASNFFAISAPHEGRILYRRCNFDARMIHCIDLTYPLEEKRAWDETVTRISRSLRPL